MTKRIFRLSIIIAFAVVLFFVGMFLWSKHRSAPFALFRIRCAIAGGVAVRRDHEPGNGIVLFWTNECRLKNRPSDIGTPCKDQKDCIGMCESELNDYWTPSYCTDVMFYQD